MDHFGVGDAHAMAIMLQFNSMIHDRTFERFPRLKVAFLEASCGWVPYAIERIDHRSAKLARNLALEQVTNHPIYFHASLEDESVLPFTISVIGDDRLLFASDFPHESLDAEAVGHDIETFLARPDLRPESKRKILCDNVKEAYSLV